MAVIGNVTLLAPAGTVTEVGAVTSQGMPTETLTVQPPAGAGDLRLIVPVDDPLPPIVAGLRLRPVIASVVTFRMALW